MRVRDLAEGLARVMGGSIGSKKFRMPRGRRRSTQARCASGRLAVEGLEDRQLLSGTGIHAGTLATFSISGRKFEDLNANGLDDADPGFGGVAIELFQDQNGNNVLEPGGPDSLIATAFTASDGAYTFSELTDGRYFVREQVPEGAIQTTSTSLYSFLGVGGQDIRNINFGNAFEGSIHGSKFEDLDVDGVRDPGEPPLANVEMVLTWTNAAGQLQTQSTRTDAGGEYWFSWLRPGITYTVRERVPQGSIQTTPDPQPIFIGSGTEYVATPTQAERVQRAVSFPWWWTIEIDPVPMDGVDPPPETIMVQGMGTIEFSEAVSPTGQTFPIVSSDNGLPLPLPDGEWQIATELTMLNLTGDDSQGRLVEVRLNDALPSEGIINALARPGSNGIVGDSFFDIFVEIEIRDPTTEVPMVLRTREPVRVGMTFTESNMEPVPPILPRTDVRWMPTFFWQEGLGRDLLDEAGNLWDEWISVHAVPHVEVEKPVRPVVLSQLDFGNAFEGSIHGFKFEDFDSDGVRDANEPGVPGVTIVLVDEETGQTTETTTTDANGEYWFKWLRPGRRYVVREIPPVGSELTTENPAAIFIGSGQEYVATREQGLKVQRAVSFPWWWTIEMVPVGQTRSVSLMAAGMASFGFTDLFNPETNELRPLVDPQTGLPNVIPADGQWLLGFELMDMQLVGIDPVIGGDLAVRGMGKGTILVSNEGLTADDGLLVATVESFFDIFIEIDVPNLETPMVLRPDQLIRVREDFDVQDRIPPRDVRWLPTMFWRMGLGRDLLDDAGEVWDRLITVHAKPHVELEKPVRPIVLPELAFGNAFRLSSIHGYKFEDLNVNGKDDGEPRLGDVTITLAGDVDGDGVVDQLVTTTNANGDYWFTGIVAGTYTVSETPTFGSVPTTPTAFTVTVGAGEELVALPGQAMIVAGDTRREVVVGPQLAFGNAFEGSIHGIEFQDRNGDGIRQANEPPLAGVTIVVSGDDGSTESTTTDANGEFWFTWLRPGVTYEVKEILPPGAVQTTPPIGPIFIGSGQEFVANQEQAASVQRKVTFPWWWNIEIIPVGQDQAVTTMVQGTATLAFSDLRDPQTGETIPIVDPVNGLPNPVPPGARWEADFELVETTLLGVDPVTGGEMTVEATGQGKIQVANITTAEEESVLVGTVESFFDVVFEITAPGGPTMTLRPEEPLTLQQVFGPGDGIPPRDVRWLPAIIWREGLGRDLLDDAGELWDTWTSIHAVPHVEVEKPVRPVVEPSLLLGNAPPVVTAGLFYNNSRFDGNDPAANEADFSAIATDKVPLQLGEKATFANVSGYTKGINGVHLEVLELPADGAMVTAADFNVWTGTTNDVGHWAAGPAPSVTVLPNTGPGGADRILLVFPDHSIRDTYVAIQLLPDASTGAAEVHTFIFGSVVGDTGAAFVGQGQFFGRDAADLQRMAQNLFQPATVVTATDITRDGRTDAFDLQAGPVASTLAIGGAFQSNVLPAITPSATAAASTAALDAVWAAGDEVLELRAQPAPLALLALEESSLQSSSTVAKDRLFGKVGQASTWSESFVPLERRSERRFAKGDEAAAPRDGQLVDAFARQRVDAVLSDLLNGQLERL